MAFLIAYQNIAFFTVILYSAIASAQILKRFEEISEWAIRDEKIFELSKARVKRLKQELSELEKFVDDYEKTTSRHLSGIKDPELQQLVKTNEDVRAYVVASNALLTYRMTHRLSTMMPRMQRAILAQDLQTDELKTILGAFTDVSQHPQVTLEPMGAEFGRYSDWLPTEDDLEGALDAMTVLYDVYSPDVLGPNDFAAMLSVGTSSPVQINAYHATKFSLKAFYHGYYGNALDWANYAHKKLEKERDYSISKELVHYMREFMGMTHNEEFGESPDRFPETISYLNFFTELANETKTWTKRKSEVQEMHALLGSDTAFSEEQVDEKEKDFQLATSQYYTVCQNARLHMLNNDSDKEIPTRLTCKLDGNINPYFYLAPLKVEIISELPRILQFYDVLSPLELEEALVEVRELPFESPYPLKEFPDEFGTRKPHLRTVMDAAIDKETLNQGGKTGVLPVIARKLEYLTGFMLMDNGYGTLYPVEKYNPARIKATEFVGGGYEALQRRKEEFGGGFQLFLQAPEEGGEVVFGGAATVGKFGKPVKGSVLFWENIGSDSAKPVEILVGSCPVVQGHKIVLSKDFYYNLNYPYSLFNTFTN